MTSRFSVRVLRRGQALPPVPLNVARSIPLSVRWFPLIPFIAYWAFAYLNFEFGLVAYPRLSGWTYTFLFVCALAIIGCYHFGYKSQAPRAFATVQQRLLQPFPEGLFKIGAWASTIGLMLLVADRLRSGITIEAVLTETAVIREITQLSLLTTAASPFAGLQPFAVLGYFYLIASRRPVSPTIHLLIGSGLAFRLALAFLSTNRLAFVYLLAWLVYFVFFMRNHSLKRFLTSLSSMKIKALLVVLALLSATYFFYIARHRIDPNYLVAITSKVDDRYRLREKIDEKDGSALIMFSTYSTQQFVFVDTLLPHASPINLDVRSLFEFFLRQLHRIGLSDMYARYYWEAMMHRDSLGLPLTGWPSVFGHGLTVFGFLGLPVFFAVVSFVFGASAASYLQRGSFNWLFLNFFIFNYTVVSFMAMGSDAYNAVSLILVILLPIVNKQGVNDPLRTGNPTRGPQKPIGVLQS